MNYKPSLPLPLIKYILSVIPIKMSSIKIHPIGSTSLLSSNRINNVAIPRKYRVATTFCILISLLQISTSSVVSGIRHIPPVHMHDVLTSDLSLLNNNRVLPAEFEVENFVDESIPKSVEEKGESWEDDDDDTVSAVDSVSKVGEDVNSQPANTAIPEGESTLIEKDIVENTALTPVEDNAMKQEQWPDDDDTNISVNNDSGVLNSANNTSLVESTSVIESNISAVIPDEESEKPTIRDKIKHKMGWNDDDDDTMHEELTVDGITTSEKSVEGEESNISGVGNEDLEVSDGEDKKEGTVSEWPEDDDDDNVSVNNADEQGDASLVDDGEEKKSSLLSTFKKVAGWDNNGDEPKGTEEENSTPEAAAEIRESSLLDGIGEKDEATEAEMEENEQVPSEWPEDDDDNNVAVDAELTNVLKRDNNPHNTPEEENKIQQGSSITNVKEEEGDVDELLGDIFDTSPEATAYHRNQSSQGDGSVAADEEVKDDVAGEVAETPNENVQQEVVEGDIQENTDGVANQSETPGIVTNGENDTPTAEETAGAVDPNEVMIPNQQEEQQQQPPIQSWDDVDDDDDSFLDMVQSTFNVLLLAVLLTSLLVLRKRVMDRVHTDGLSIPEAIKDELIDVVIRFASWSASVLTGTQNDSNNSTEDDTNERQNSRGNETIPLAADEEWGWEDEENQFGTELSGMGRGNEEKEDDDLAMAIAMSLSESQKEKKATISSSSLSSKSNYNQQPPQRQSSSTSFSNKRTSPQLTSTSPPPPSSSGGGDSIEDLLGQMGGSNKITSFGQKPKTKPKPAKKQQENNDDDLFASMGLSSIPKPTTRPSAAPTSSGWKAKQTIQQSAPTPSLVADSFGDDGDGDDWGDDGDLDDLLDD